MSSSLSIADSEPLARELSTQLSAKVDLTTLSDAQVRLLGHLLSTRSRVAEPAKAEASYAEVPADAVVVAEEVGDEALILQV
jgi:hypothetical protein